MHTNDLIAEFTDTLKLLGIGYEVYIAFVIGIRSAKDIGDLGFGNVVDLMDDPTTDKLGVFQFGRLEVGEILGRKNHAHAKHTTLGNDIAKGVKVFIHELMCLIHKNHCTKFTIAAEGPTLTQ